MKSWDSTQDKSNSTATNVHDPAETDRINQASVSETLYKQPKRKPAPCTDEVLCRLPEEDGNSSTNGTRNNRSQNEHPPHRLTWRIDGSQYTELEDQNDANK